MSPLEFPPKTPHYVQGRFARVVTKWSRGVWIEDPPTKKE